MKQTVYGGTAEAGLTILRRDESIPKHIRDWTPRSGLGFAILRAVPFLPRDLQLELVDRIASAAVIESELRLKAMRGLGLVKAGLLPAQELVVEDYGIVSRRVVTDTGVGFIVDAFQNLTEIENMKFHGIGTGGAAEAAANTGLTTELTTEYNPNSTRATGTTTESAANIYQTVATNTLDSGTPSITEHAVFSAASAGVMLDRSLFTAIALNGTNGDGLQSDYRFTITAGS